MKENTSLGKRIVTSALILIVAVIVIVLLAMGFGKIGIPLWPFILLLFFYSSVYHFDPDKLLSTSISGVLGIIVGMSQAVITQLTSNSTVGLIGFGLLALIFCTAFIMGDVFWSNVFGVIMMTILTLFNLEPCVWAGMPQAAGMGALEALIRVLGSYAIGVILFVVVVSVMKAKKQ